jgi:hypothetical protein
LEKNEQLPTENTKLFKDRAHTTEEIQRLLTKADERMRVVILLLASTGIASNISNDIVSDFVLRDLVLR